MLGSILKYTAIAMAGAVAFTTAGFFMDADVVDAARKEVEDYEAVNKNLPAADLKQACGTFIVTHRDRWIKDLTFARSIEDLDAALARWL